MEYEDILQIILLIYERELGFQIYLSANLREVGGTYEDATRILKRIEQLLPIDQPFHPSFLLHESVERIALIIARGLTGYSVRYLDPITVGSDVHMDVHVIGVSDFPWVPRKSPADLGPVTFPPVASRAGIQTPVWFGTNRRPAGGEKLTFTTDRDEQTHYGRCQVFVPRSHRIGELGSPFWKRTLRGKDDRLKLVRTQQLAEDDLWHELRSALGAVREEHRNAVIFIHGYNVSFADAALRAGQIGYDLQVPAMGFFSWPSRGRIRSYFSDEATIEFSEAAITEFLVKFAKLRDSARVHVIAHSMGNRAVLRAFDRIVRDAQVRSDAQFNQIILAAPDVDRGTFTQLACAYHDFSERTTLYLSARDRAVSGSRWLHEADRVGYTPPVTIVPGIDTVSVTDVDLSLLGHGFVAENKEVLYDMHDLIFNGTPPDRRMALRAAEFEGKPYWEIRA